MVPAGHTHTFTHQEVNYWPSKGHCQRENGHTCQLDNGLLFFCGGNVALQAQQQQQCLKSPNGDRRGQLASDKAQETVVITTKSTVAVVEAEPALSVIKAKDIIRL